MLWSVLVAIISVTVWLAPASPGPFRPAITVPEPGWRAARAQETEPGAELCAAMGEAASPEWLGAGALAAADVSLLADAVVDQVPAADSVLSAGQMSLDPITSSRSRMATGPLLLLVQSGSVTLYIEGSPIMLDAGESAGVAPGQLYLIENGTAETASLLRLAVTPPGDDTVEVADFIPAPRIAASNEVTPEANLLVRTPPLALPAPPARLFLACLRWQYSDDSPDPLSHPGPVGLWVIAGSLTVDEQRTLPAAGCAVFGPGEAHLTRASEPATVVLLFGIVAAGQPFWQPGGTAPDLTALDGLTCGDPPPA